MNTKHTDLAAEYLREVDQRLAGLPVLQRRELLADLAAHIESERVERNLSEGELIEVLERLGSPEVIAAAAREEAAVQGRGPGADAWAPRETWAPQESWAPQEAWAPQEPARPRRYWLIAVVAAVVLLAGLLVLGASFFLRSGGSSVDLREPPPVVETAPIPERSPAPPAPTR
jgi:hypothetical protein